MGDTVGTTSHDSAARGVAFARASLVVFGAGQSAAFIALPIVFRQLGLSESMAGLVFGLASAVSIFTAPMLGRQSDRLGRRYTLSACLGAYGIATFLFGMALYYFSATPATALAVVATLLLLRMLAGGMGSGIFPSCQGYIADSFEPRQRLGESGRLSAAMNLGLLAGALTISALGALAWRIEAALLAIGIVAGCFGAAIAAVFPVAAKLPPGARPRRITARDSRVGTIVLICVAFVAAQALVQQMMGFLVQDRLALTGAKAGFWTGLCFIAAVVASMLSQALLISRISGRLVLPLAFLVSGAALLAASRATTGIELVGCLFVTGLAFGFVFPTLMNMASTRVSREEQGGVAGVMASVSAFGLAVGPITGGVLYDAVGPVAYALAAALLGVLALAALAHKPAAES
jgi:MFS family permease